MFVTHHNIRAGFTFHTDRSPQLLTLVVNKVLMMIDFCILKLGEYFQMFEHLQ